MHRIFQNFIERICASGDTETLLSSMAQATAALDLDWLLIFIVRARRQPHPDRQSWSGATQRALRNEADAFFLFAMAKFPRMALPE
jgi:hypothetical protein